MAPTSNLWIGLYQDTSSFNYSENNGGWKWVDGTLLDYNWSDLLNRLDTKVYSKRMDQLFYPKMKEIGAITKKGKLISKHYNLYSKQYQCNPDWDEDVILKLFDLIGNSLNWTPPKLPNIIKIIKTL